MKTIISSLLAAAFVLSASPSMAACKSGQCRKNVAKLKKTRKCPKCDLRGANLSGAKLWEANLRGANLRFAKLRGARLHRANLRHAFVVGVDLLGTRFCKTTMTNGKIRNDHC
jgi:uncharacterized protein YjbI with pentapeptide repeats